MRILLMLLFAALLVPCAGISQGNPVDSLRDWLSTEPEKRIPLRGWEWATTPLTTEQAIEAEALLIAEYQRGSRERLKTQWENKQLASSIGRMKFTVRTIGKKPKAGWPLYISMHGGGGAPAEVNDKQWKNQQTLYSPDPGLYICPRAPTNKWDLWHQPAIDKLFDQLIEAAVLFGEADRNRVYLMGYSAGGDGVYQLAPRMADRFAAAAMMAGHPNDAQPDGLRNLPFALYMGGLDSAYNRNRVAEEWGNKLKSLQANDRGGYTHSINIYPELGHWMERNDTSAVEWLRLFTRKPYPDRVVWRLNKTAGPTYYWLGAEGEMDREEGHVHIRQVGGQNFEIESAEGLEVLFIYLNRNMVELNQVVTVTWNDNEVYMGPVEHTLLTMYETLNQRGDPSYMFSGKLQITVDEPID